MKTSNTDAYEKRLVAQREPLMRYREGESFQKWQKEARAMLASLLGLSEMGQTSPDLTLEWTQREESYTEYRFTVETEPDYLVPCHLRIPTQVTSPVPLTVCLSGHGGGMHVALGVAKTPEDEEALSEWYHRAMAVRAIRDGRAALVIEARSFGECSLEGYGTSCTEAAKNAMLIGRTVIGERVWDAMRVLDAVLSRFDVIDTGDIVCTGNSGGGTATYYLACMDERITAALPSCSVCSYEASIVARRHCLCNHIPSIRRYFEMGDLGGLIAPRMLVVAAGEKDGGFPISGTRDAFALIERAYAAAGVPRNCALTVADGDHLNYADHLWEALSNVRARSPMEDTKE